MRKNKEELKLLVESIAGLPDLAIWVVAMYFFFKLAIVGSIFGVARLFINKVHNIYSVKYNKPEPPVIEETNIHFGQYVISAYHKNIKEEIERLLKLMIGKDYTYIHMEDISDLRKFIDNYGEYMREKTKEV